MFMVHLSIDLRKDRENRKGYPLFIRISHKGKKAYVATGITVKTSQFKDQKIRNRDDCRELNERIQNQVSQINTIINKLIKENSELIPAYIKDLYTEERSEKKKAVNLTGKSLYTLMAEYVELGRGKKYQTLGKSTIKVIRDSLVITKTNNSHPNFGNFLANRNLIELKPEKLSLRLVKDYIIFLEEAGLSINTQSKRLKHLKAFLLTIKELLPFSLLDMPIISEIPKEVIHLTSRELQLVIQYEPVSDLEQRAKDMFLILCFTGLRIGDAASIEPGIFRKSPNGYRYISKIMEKTKKRVEPVLEQEVEDIFSKYHDTAPKISEQDLREQIKLICKKAGIDEIIEFVEYKHGKKIVKQAEKYKLISPHTGRKTRVMMLNERGVLLPHIASQIGDKIETMLRYYFKEDKEKSQLAVIENGRLKIA